LELWAWPSLLIRTSTSLLSSIVVVAVVSMTFGRLQKQKHG
jgi:hypothetical protein